MKAAYCNVYGCVLPHCVQCGTVLLISEANNCTVMPPLIGEYFVCQKCFDIHVAQERKQPDA